MLVQFFVKITGRVNTSNDSIRQVAVSLLLSLVGAFSQLGNAKEELQFYNKNLFLFHRYGMSKVNYLLCAT